MTLLLPIVRAFFYPCFQCQHFASKACHTVFYRIEDAFKYTKLIILWMWNKLWWVCMHFCDRKAWAACVQSFALWQQATIEITCHDHSSRMPVCSIVHIIVLAEIARHDHSIIACSRHIFMGVVLRAHSVHGANGFRFNSHLADFTSFLSLLSFRLTCYLYGL